MKNEPDNTPLKDTSTLRKRQRKAIDNFMSGKARNAYELSSWYQSAFEKATPNIAQKKPTSTTASKPKSDKDILTIAKSAKNNLGECRCLYPLKSGKVWFDSFRHSAKELKRRRKTNKTGLDINAQNGWLLSNCFDVTGNYIYHQKCICKALKINNKRLARIHAIAIQMAERDFEVMHKNKIPSTRFMDITPPDNLNPSDVLEWWASLPASADVTLRPKNNTHGLQNLRAPNAKNEKTIESFLSFIDCNRQFNGRAEGSRCARFYLSSKFIHFDMSDISLKKGSEASEKAKRTCFVQEFNRAQQAKVPVAEIIGKSTARSWFKLYRPDTRLAPHKTDFCDFCAEMNSHRLAALQTITRIRGTAEKDIIEYYEKLAESHAINKEEHLEDANNACNEYKESLKKSRSQAKNIQKLKNNIAKDTQKISSDELDQLKARLTQLKNNFINVISCDFMQSANLPFWGESPQPAKTYYQKKIVYDVFGLVDESWDRKYVYVSNEKFTGAKNSDHTINYLHHYFTNHMPAWVKNIEIWLDNAVATNKNKYVIAYAAEIVALGLYDDIRVRFMVPGHTKFTPDILFSSISRTYRLRDVFNTKQLLDIISQYATATFMKGEDFVSWKKYIDTCYDVFSGIRTVHDFHLFRGKGGTTEIETSESVHNKDFNPIDILKFRKKKKKSPLPFLPNDSYVATGISRGIEEKFESKLEDLQKQYDSYILDEHRFDWLPPRARPCVNESVLRANSESKHREPATSELSREQLKAEKSAQQNVASVSRKRSRVRKTVAEKGKSK